MTASMVFFGVMAIFFGLAFSFTSAWYFALLGIACVIIANLTYKSAHDKEFDRTYNHFMNSGN